jgi:hypothetical protein
MWGTRVRTWARGLNRGWRPHLESFHNVRVLRQPPLDLAMNLRDIAASGTPGPGGHASVGNAVKL